MKKEKIQIVCKKEILKKEINFYGSIEYPYFLPSDVASWLGITNYRQMIKSAELSDDQKGVFLIDTLGGEQEKVFITEDGLYDTLMASRKKESKPLKNEIKSYLKQIRLTGGYISIKEEDTPELIMAKALKVADETIKNKDIIIKELKPKADAYDDLINSDGYMSLKEVGDMIEVGRNTLCGLLRNKKVMSKQTGYNLPLNRYTKAGYFKVVAKSDDRGHTAPVTIVSTKGLNYIYKLIKKNEMLDKFNTEPLLIGGIK